MSKKDYLAQLRAGNTLSFQQQLCLIIELSMPAIMAQISSIVMQYIDASMVGKLGAADSAAIGLMSSTTWLMGGLCSAASVGFTVQIAHRIGSGEEEKARNIVFQGLICVLAVGCLLMIVGLLLSRQLPIWLGGNPEICSKASAYFWIYAISLPAVQVNNTVSGMLQCSGNMKLPSILHVVMCGLDVIFNLLLIFPSNNYILGKYSFYMPGADLGVSGAALGTALSQLIIAMIMLFYLVFKSPVLKYRRNDTYVMSFKIIKKAAKMSFPVAFEQTVLCGAYIMATKIVAPLGTVAIAANSFSVTAESLCYMPGYGIGMAATTLIGQSIGAGRKDLTRRLGWITTILGMVVMGISAIIMYMIAPIMIALLSPDGEIRNLGTEVLRIVVFAEPMYAASIVASGVFRGAGDTFVPSCLNFCSMWLIRLPLSAWMASRYGLQGVWIAMSIELCFRGILFLLRLSGKKWDKSKISKKL